LSQQLIGLVQADPVLMIFALENLGKNVPKASNPYYGRIVHTIIEPISAEVLPLLIGNDPAHRLTPDQIARLEKIWGRRAEEMAELTRTAEKVRGLVKTARGADIDAIRSRLRDDSPVVRQITLQVIAHRRLPLEGDLIEQIRDPRVANTAHEALVRLSRGTDFGPYPGSSRRGIDRSIEKWRQWLTLQQSTAPHRSAAAEGKRDASASLEIVLPVLSQDEKPALPSEVDRAFNELINSKGNGQLSTLARLRDAKDSESTEAIALAIPKLSGDIQQQARDALTERLTRLSSAVLRDKLQDDNLEVRCATALACGRKIARDLIADLLQLLDDPEMAVVQSARVALTELTGEDFGPTSDADQRGRGDAVAAWRKWWKERQDKQK
jgi:hypothetical protein